MPKISEYCEIIKDDISNNDVKFAPFFYSVLGLTEEIMELEEVYEENFESKIELMSESGDVIFYCFQLINRLNVTDNFITKYQIQEYKDNLRINDSKLLDNKSKSINKNLYLLRKNAGKVVGITKKMIRVRESITEDRLKQIQAHVADIITGVFRILDLLNLSVEICFEENLKKREIRLKQYQQKIEENEKKRKSTKKVENE